MNIKIIKVFGLQRSGTNLMDLLIPLNFNVETCKRNGEKNDYLGWKHANPKHDHSYKTIEEITKDEIYFVFCYREKNEWLRAMREKHLGNFETPHYCDFTKNTNNFILNTPCGPEIYNSLEEYYDIRLDNFLKFITQNKSKSILINFTDLKNNQEFVLENIKNKFNLEKINENYITIKKKINCHGEVTAEIL